MKGAATSAAVKNKSAPASCLQIFFADMQTHGVWPVISQKRGNEFVHLAKPEAAAWVQSAARAFLAHDVTAETRVLLYGRPSRELWAAEWGVLACRGVAVILPAQEFDARELLEMLAESKSRIVVVDSLAVASRIAGAMGNMPDLKRIVCIEGAGAPVLSWQDFLAVGAGRKDELKELLATIKGGDRAMLMYHKNDAGEKSALNYTHGEFLERARTMDRLVAEHTARESSAFEVKYKHKGKWRKAVTYSPLLKVESAYIGNLDVVLAAVPWGHALGHFMGYCIPLLKTGVVQLMENVQAAELPDYKPQVIVGDAQYLEAVREHVTGIVRKSGALKWASFTSMLELGRQKYETTRKLGLLRRVEDAMLRRSISKHVHKLLGGRLRLVIGVDDMARYETKLFFHAFDIGFVELPAALLATPQGAF